MFNRRRESRPDLIEGSDDTLPPIDLGVLDERIKRAQEETITNFKWDSEAASAIRRERDKILQEDERTQTHWRG